MESLLDLFLRLFGGDQELMRAYQADPQGFAQQHFGDLCAADWRDLQHALGQSGLMGQGAGNGGAAPDSGDSPHGGDGGARPDSSDDGGYGSSGYGSSGYGSSGYGSSGHGSSDGADPHHGEDSDHAIVQLHKIINSFNQIDDRDTITDQSVHQKVWTGGGDFWQHIDNDASVASGDGAVVADHTKGPINTGKVDDSDHSKDTNNVALVTGDGNIVGDDNDGNVVGWGNVVGNDWSTHSANAGGDIDTTLAGHDIDNSQEHEAKFDDSFNGWFNGNSDSFNNHSVSDSFNDANNSFNPDNSFNGNSVVSDDAAAAAPPTAAEAPGAAPSDSTLFDSNYVEGSFNNNDVDHSFNHNDLDNSLNNNTVDDSFNHNDLDNSLNSNTVDDSPNNNTVDDSFNHSSVADHSTTTQNGPGIDEVLSHNSVPVTMDVTMPSGF